MDEVEGFTTDEGAGMIGRYHLALKEFRSKNTLKSVGFTRDYIRELDGKLVVPVNFEGTGAVHLFNEYSDAPGDDYSLMYALNTNLKMVKTISGSKTFPIIILAILLGVTLLGVFVYNQFFKGDETAPIENGAGEEPIEEVGYRMESQGSLNSEKYLLVNYESGLEV